MAERRVCDTCNARKVRCDRNDPCGNCLDQNTTCTRSRRMRRLPKRDRSQMQRDARHAESNSHRPLDRGQGQGQTPRPPESSLRRLGNDDDGLLRGMLDDQQLMLLGQFDMNMNMTVGYGLQSWMSIVPLTEAQMINRRQFDHSQDLSWTRQQALESALSAAGRILGSMEMRSEMTPGEGSGQRHIPSLEFLYWMLNDIGSDKFGPFISDYFRHVGKEDLKTMGLALLFNTASSSDSTIFTVCVNSIAFKFLNATLGAGADDNDEFAQRLSHNALLYRETAKAALQRIPILAKPSFHLLQALLCGIFLYQGSGDTTACRELAKTACRVCMDIGLHPAATNLHNVSEAEYYCFMWCYMLDRNYAWKFGGPRILTVEPDVDISPPAPTITISNLMHIYLDLAKVQDGMIPFLNDPVKAARDNVFQPATGVGALYLQKMEGIRRDINQIKEPSPNWKGLDPASEIATLNFAYHCILTNLLHLRQIALGEPPTAGPAATSTDTDTYLDSARRGLQALITLCTSGDRHKTVAYLHWTLLFYPITTCIALFCNTVATSHTGDFAILTTVSHCLAQTGPLSPPIAAMQSLLQEFVALSRCFFLTIGNGDGSGSVTSGMDMGISGHGIAPLQLQLPASTPLPSEADINVDPMTTMPMPMPTTGGLDPLALTATDIMNLGLSLDDGNIAAQDQEHGQREYGLEAGTAGFSIDFA
ncbi:Zn(II)2Cys6 transcription factor [Aspergillus mulundensis]|uniref:Zn(2)-C6 fungal-type domain-containing protein n=1 Tax=Aspergillus mulundensis TaxID=1810919 RepID=A0A3D8QCE6_9EURO|nr:Uncharacterized protein DSM5745_11005 [Aspergillus mulundensis]RDW59310.1 Uncharacterized protein DSM5745_11005 [Aspergillus mulundensis]